MNDDTGPGEGQAEDAGDNNESTSAMMANDNVGTCLDPMSPDYDEDEAIRVATEKSIQEVIHNAKEPSIQFGDYRCPKILAKLAVIIAEIRGLPEDKRPSRKAYWDQVEEEWQAAQATKSYN